MLHTLPLAFVLAGVVLYTVLAGADFGAGIWQLLSGPGERGERIREHAHESMGPVWEANHVWLIFVLTVTWTAYPVFLGSLASTLSVALFIAALGIILRGASYALRSGARDARETLVIDGMFSIASLVTPFALGCAAGAIAAERVPVGNAAGQPFSSWLAAVPVTIGVLAVCFSVYMAAIFLAGDAQRSGDTEMADAFRARSLIAGAIAGAAAIAALIVVHGNAHSLYSGLVHGGALATVIVSLVAGILTLVLVWIRRYEPARVTGAVAVAAVIAAWALARNPVLLPGLTIEQAAAGHDALVTVIVAVIAGGIIMFPALGALFALTLRRRSQPMPGSETAAGAAHVGTPLRVSAGAPRVAVALFIVGIGMLNAANAGWCHIIGVVALFGFLVAGFVAVVPRALATDEP
ncbi:MAG TPA: cytochrome d ubiquinol oxidase subunit II [Solirubrobacteraceae bacterium]|jgi:cytochrome bd ubiquinol oxidase subunit II|nr:cytochrome d ubiquinol oxidase subunit II [Solirubrobacteraceae bacterium]